LIAGAGSVVILKMSAPSSFSSLPSSSPPPRDEILVRVSGVSKKFCRSLKQSLWYGVQDIAHELNPFTKNAEKLKTEKLKSQNPLSACQRFSFSTVTP